MDVTGQWGRGVTKTIGALLEIAVVLFAAESFGRTSGPELPSAAAVQSAQEQILPELGYRREVWGPPRVTKLEWKQIRSTSDNGEETQLWRVIAIFAYKNRRPIREAHDLIVVGDRVSPANRSSGDRIEQAVLQSKSKQRDRIENDQKRFADAARAVSDRLVTDAAFRARNAERPMIDLVREELDQAQRPPRNR